MKSERWEEIETTIGYLHQDIQPADGQRVFDYIFEEIEGEERELHAYKCDIVTEALHLDPQALMSDYPAAAPPQGCAVLRWKSRISCSMS